MLKDCNSRKRWILIGGIGSVFVIMICILYLYGSPKRLFERKYGYAGQWGVQGGDIARVLTAWSTGNWKKWK